MFSIQLKPMDIPGRGPLKKNQGETYHKADGFHPLQVIIHPTLDYFLLIIDSDAALEHRMRNVTDASSDPQLMAIFQTVLEHHKPYDQVFKFAKVYMDAATNVQLQFRIDNAFDPGRHNGAKTNQVASVLFQ